MKRNYKWWVEGLVVATILLIIAIIFTWPLVLHFSEAIPMGGLPSAVAVEQLFNAEWSGMALDEGRPYWEAPLLYPFQGVFAWREIQPFSNILIWLVAKLTGYVFAYNLLIIIYMVGFGLVGYASSRLLTQERIAALWCGIWLTAGAYSLQQIYGHSLLAAAFPTGCIFFSLVFIKKKTYRYFWLAVFFYLFTWLTCKQMGFYLSLLLPIILWPFFSWGKWRLFTIFHLLLALALFFLAVVPYSLRQLSYAKPMGFEYRLSDVRGVYFLPNLFIPAKGHWLTTHILGLNYFSWDAGVIVLSVIIISVFLGIFKHRLLDNYQKKIIFGLIAMIIAALPLGFGPNLRIVINGIRFIPYALFFHFIPGMKYIRAPSRFGLFIIFGVAVISALALAFIRSRIKTANKKLAVTVFLFVLLFAEMWTMPISLVFSGRETRVHQGVIDWLHKQGGGKPVFELPVSLGLYPSAMELESWSMYHMLRHHNPTIGGYGTFFPLSYSQLKQAIIENPAGRGRRYLGAYGARYIVVHNHKLSSGQQKDFPPALGNNVVYSDEGHSIYLLPEKKQAQDIRDFLPPSANFDNKIPQQGKIYGLALKKQPQEAILITPQSDLRIDFNWRDETGQRRTKRIRLLGSVILDIEHPRLYFRILRFPRGDKEAEAKFVSAEEVGEIEKQQH